MVEPGTGDNGVTVPVENMKIFLPKTLSYDGDYHSKYYYPKLVYARKLRKQEEAAENSTCVSSLSGNTVGESSTWSEHVNSPTTKSGSADIVHKANAKQEGNIKQTADISPGLAMAGISQDLPDAECTSPSAKESSSLSYTSEDTDITVYSEDYTDMDSDLHLSSPADHEASANNDIDWGAEGTVPSRDDDEDSSFTERCSIGSAPENGADLETAVKDKLQTAEPLGIVGRKRPNIKLILGSSPPDMDDDDPTSPESPDEPGGQEGKACNGPWGGDTGSQGEGGGGVSKSASAFYDEEFDFLKTEPVRRTTSLKTYKTPPGTPSKKKAVRFADALGLDLESIRHIMNMEDPPLVPKSAMRDLKIGVEEDRKTQGVRYLSACFSQPVAEPSFMRRVRDCKVVLENCVVDDKELTISGTVRVLNIAYHKQVMIRFSVNNWLTFQDVNTCYVQNSFDGSTDRFAFTIIVPPYFQVGNRLGFAIMYTTNGQIYWDNNHGRNYVVECYARAMPATESDKTWIHFL